MKHSLAPFLILGAVVLPGLLSTPARAATMILHSFTGGTSDGSNPWGSLTLSGSKLYGMTARGGGSDFGTLFSMNTDGTGFGLLHSFTGGASDGSNPRGSLTLSGSKLYGMTLMGGSDGTGMIFSMNIDGTGFALLHTFTNGSSDGQNPTGSLTLSGSKLYGMTTEGGSNDTGTLFSMNTDGTGFGLLHSFTGGASDGKFPNGSLTLSGSTLYGMTWAGGSGEAGALFTGTLFSIGTDGTGFGLLHSFVGSPSDGARPNGSLTLAGSKLYGMTELGGSAGQGALFTMNSDGTGFGLLHSFHGGASDGSQPRGSLTLSGSLLYGMSAFGGSSGEGALFRIGVDGFGFQLMESFSGAPRSPGHPVYSDLTLSGDGKTLYGMTYEGGTVTNQGVVFSAPTPEPGTFALLGLGTLLLSARRRNAQA